MSLEFILFLIAFVIAGLTVSWMCYLSYQDRKELIEMGVYNDTSLNHITIKL